MWWVVGVVAVVVVFATYATWTAARVDRLHARAAAAYAALDAQLVRRAAGAAILADEVGQPRLRSAAQAALAATGDEREAAENDLTRLLRTLGLGAEDPAHTEVVTASRRVALARGVHNDLVRDALGIRSRPLIRLLRMTRRHDAPAYFDIDDTKLDTTRPPAGHML